MFFMSTHLGKEFFNTLVSKNPELDWFKSLHGSLIFE